MKIFIFLFTFSVFFIYPNSNASYDKDRSDTLGSLLEVKFDDSCIKIKNDLFIKAPIGVATVKLLQENPTYLIASFKSDSKSPEEGAFIRQVIYKEKSQSDSDIAFTKFKKKEFFDLLKKDTRALLVNDENTFCVSDQNTLATQNYGAFCISNLNPGILTYNIFTKNKISEKETNDIIEHYLMKKICRYLLH